MSTPASDGAAPEGFWARQVRVLVHARFRGGEQVVIGDPADGETLNQYLRGGPRGRWWSRAFALGIALACGVAATGALGLLLAGGTTGWGMLLAAGFGSGCGYVSLWHWAGWRCMRRHRHRPIGSRPLG